VRHEEAWRRLPDLLDDRDDPGLVAHVRECTRCQRQLFLLGRVDRLLRDSATTRRRLRRRPVRTRILTLSAAAIAAGAATLALTVPQRTPSHGLVLRTAQGLSVGRATISSGDSRNASLSLTARHLPADHGQTFVLWAGDSSSSAMQVGRFMVDRSGGCRVRFNLPDTHSWTRFWVTKPGGTSVVAST